MKTILATTSSFGKSSPEAARKLVERGYELVTNPHGRKLTEDELVELLAKHRPIGLLAGTEPVTGNVLEGASDFLKTVSRVGVGWDNVDHDAAKKLGIDVFRTEGVLDNSVAELALGMMLSAHRALALMDRGIRSGKWKKRMGSLLSGKTLGIIGFGAIGRKLAEFVRPMDVKVIFSDVAPVQTDHAEQVELSDLVERADVISIHASGSGCILGPDELARCKPEVILVNTARGGLIDEKALYDGLKSGRLGWACIDVFDKEPYEGPLAELDNTVLTCHVGSYAKEARMEMEALSVDNLLLGLEK